MHKRISIVCLGMSLIMSFIACKKATDVSVDPQRNIARAIDGIAGGISEMITVLDELTALERIDAHEDAAMSRTLLKLNGASSAFRATAIAAGHDGEDTLRGYHVLQVAMDNVDAELLNIKSTAARQRFQQIMAAIRASLIVIENAVVGR